MRPIRMLLITILALLFLTACNIHDNEPLPTLMQLPTVTLATELTAEATDNPLVTLLPPGDLSQRFSGGDVLGREITAQYPAEWVFADLLLTDGALVLSNSQAALDNPEATLEAGAVLVTVSAIPAEFAMDEEGNVQSLVDLVGSVAAESQAVEAVSEFMLGEFNAAQATFTGDQGDLLVVVVAQERGFVVVAASTPQGEMPAQQATVLGIAATVRYTVPTFD